MKEFNIESEDSSVHWQYIDPRGKNFLDLGCGRWVGVTHEEFSSIWLANKGANKVVGVDSLIQEINYFNQTNNDNNKCIFIHESIDSDTQLKNLINDHDINAIKCDIEGHEVNFLNFTKEDFDNIDIFAIEYHGHEIKNKFLEKLPYWGFEIYAHGKLWVDGVGVFFTKKVK